MFCYIENLQGHICSHIFLDCFHFTALIGKVKQMVLSKFLPFLNPLISFLAWMGVTMPKISSSLMYSRSSVVNTPAASNFAKSLLNCSSFMSGTLFQHTLSMSDIITVSLSVSVSEAVLELSSL